jgi:hypothetical protein
MTPGRPRGRRPWHWWDAVRQRPLVAGLPVVLGLGLGLALGLSPRYRASALLAVEVDGQGGAAAHALPAGWLERRQVDFNAQLRAPGRCRSS